MGDLTAGLFLANLLNGKSDVDAFEHMANAVNEVMQTTLERGEYELQIIAARDLLSTRVATTKHKKSRNAQLPPVPREEILSAYAS